MLFVGGCRGGIEDDIEGLSLLEQSVDALGGSCQALLARPRQALGISNDAGHEHGTQKMTPFEFVHEIGADIAGAQDRRADLFHDHPLC